MAGTTTTRWARQGEDRLYVRAADGRRLGWFDLRTGTTHLVDPEAEPDVTAAVDAYAAAHSPLRRRAAPPATGAGVPAPSPHAAEPRPESLRDRFPGEHVAHLLVSRAAPAATAVTGPVGDAFAGPEDGPEGGDDVDPEVGPLPVPVARVRPRRWWPSGRDPLGPALRHAHQAALGQQEVAGVLAGLGARWHVLHAVPTSGRSWLDHLLVGPGGVVVLRTAAHPGEAVRLTGTLSRVGGRPVSHVRLVLRQAATVAERLRGADLPVAVRAAVVVVGARSLQADGLPAGVTAVALQDLRAWLEDLPTVLSQVDVSRLAETAARPSTWPTEVDAPRDARARQRRREHDRAALARLTARAREAGRVRRVRRAALLGGASTGLAGAVVALVPDALPTAVAAVGMIGG